MTRSSEQKKSLRGLYYAATLGSKAAAQKVKETLEALRVGPRRKPAAPRKAAPIIRKATPAARPTAVSKAHQGDNGSTLMTARGYADRVRLHARIIASAPNRNATPAEITFCKLARTLPARRPNDSTPLREWRAYAAAVESLKAAITKTKVTF